MDASSSRNDPAATTTSNHHAQTLQRFPAIGLVSHVGLDETAPFDKSKTIFTVTP